MMVTKQLVHQGERVISRKAIAQGRPGVLRCPVCSCALCFVLSHTRPRVQRAPGLPCALSIGGREVSSKPRAHRVARMQTHIGNLDIESGLAAFSLLPLWEKVARSAG